MRGKVIMLMTDVPGRPVVILKADPVDAHTYSTDTRAAR